MRQQSSTATRLLASAALTAILAVGLGGCQTTGMPDITGSLGSRAKAEPNPEADARHAIDVYGERFRANPRDADAALKYGQALRAIGQRAQAVAVLERALQHVRDRLEPSVGVLGEARRVISRVGAVDLVEQEERIEQRQRAATE